MPLHPRLGLALVFSCALIAPAPSALALTTVPAFEVGTISWNYGTNYSYLIPSYETGVMDCCRAGWLAFDLSSIGFQVTGAILRLEFYSYSSWDPSETLGVYDSDTPSSPSASRGWRCAAGDWPERCARGEEEDAGREGP